MQYVSIQQLSSKVGENRCLGDDFVFLGTEDIRLLSGVRIIGCRVMSLVCRGNMEIFINGVGRIVGENSLTDIFEGTAIGFGNISQDAEVFVVATTRSFLMNAVQGVIPEFENYRLGVLLNPVMDIGQHGTSGLLRHIRVLDEILDDLDHKYRREIVKIYIKAFYLEFADVLSAKETDSPAFRKLNKRELVMASFMDLVWKHFTERREVSFYAHELCVTPKHLSRIVREVSGKSPHEIIATETMAFAVQLLRDEDLMVQRVADILHFSDQAAFSKFFRKYAGMSPNEYRKRHTD